MQTFCPGTKQEGSKFLQPENTDSLVQPPSQLPAVLRPCPDGLHAGSLEEACYQWFTPREGGQETYLALSKALVFLSPELEKAVTVKILSLSLPVEGSLAESLVAPGGGHTTKGVNKGGGGCFL